MKTKWVAILCAALLCITGINEARAAEKAPGPVAVGVDAVVVRPVGFASMVVGSVLFVVALPVAAASKSVKPTADALVNKPVRATFKRRLGDLDAMAD